jgi:catechol 2,3-dioxygenase-like lactoylglutathione lyase family enzyme
VLARKIERLNAEEEKMITGAHVVLYTKDAEADRAFFRDVLGFVSVDAGHGWLIFALPPAEVAMHPAEHNDRAELYLMCDDLKAEIAELVKKDAVFEEPHQERWGTVTKIRLPGGGSLGLYQPSHPTATDTAK